MINFLHYFIPRFLKSKPFPLLQDDKKFAPEIVRYRFGWNWKMWTIDKPTGKMFKLALYQPSMKDVHNGFYKPKSGNQILYYGENLLPYEYEPFNGDIK